MKICSECKHWKRYNGEVYGEEDNRGLGNCCAPLPQWATKVTPTMACYEECNGCKCFVEKHPV